MNIELLLPTIVSSNVIMCGYIQDWMTISDKKLSLKRAQFQRSPLKPTCNSISYNFHLLEYLIPSFWFGNLHCFHLDVLPVPSCAGFFNSPISLSAKKNIIIDGRAFHLSPPFIGIILIVPVCVCVYNLMSFDSATEAIAYSGHGYLVISMWEIARTKGDVSS